MSSNPTPVDHSLLIAQIEPPQQGDGGDYYYRTHAPGIAMSEEDGVYVVNLTNVHRDKDRIMRQADVLILKNICDPDILPLIGERKEQKKPTVYELADDLCAVPPWNPVHFFYRNPENLFLFKRLAHHCDAVQFSSPELQRLYEYLAPCSRVFLNQISVVPPEKGFGNQGEIIIGWGGSHGHLEDMAEVAEPLIDWVQSLDNVRICLMCSDPIWSLFDRMSPTRKRRFETGSLEDYYAFLQKIDIGIAPLKDTAFNRSRSDVKFLEYAVNHVVPVVQASVPYTSSVNHGETGFLFEDTSAMLDILRTLVENGHLISKIGRAARNYVIGERLEHQHAKKRVNFYKKKQEAVQDPEQGRNGAREIFEELSRREVADRSGRHLRLVPTHFENLLYDGLVLDQVEGKKIEARSRFSEAMRLAPESYLPYLFGAFSSGDKAGWLKKAIEKNPRSIKSCVLLGEEYAQKGDVVKSIRCFESAAKIFPEYEIPYLRTASVLQKLGKKKESEDLLEHAEKLMQPLKRPD